MALISCPECNNNCSSTASSCPKCGYKLSKISFDNLKSIGSKNILKILTLIIGVVAIFLVSVVVYQMFVGTNNSGESQKEENQIEKDSTKNAVKALKKIETGLRFKISNAKFTELLMEANTALEEANSELPDGEFKTNLNLAIEAYSDAYYISTAKNVGRYVDVEDIIYFEETYKDEKPIIFTVDPQVLKLQKKYQIPILDTSNSSDDEKKLKFIAKELALQMIFRKAIEYSHKVSLQK